VKPEHAIAREEIFGPVFAVIKVRDLDKAFAVANGTDYALTGGLFSRSPHALARAERELECGNLYLNRAITGAIVERHPFGGYKIERRRHESRRQGLPRKLPLPARGRRKRHAPRLHTGRHLIGQRLPKPTSSQSARRCSRAISPPRPRNNFVRSLAAKVQPLASVRCALLGRQMTLVQSAV